MRYDPALRQFYLVGTGSDDGIDTVAEGGSLERNNIINADTILLQIPDACLVTLHSIENDTAFGKSLFGVVRTPCSSQTRLLSTMTIELDFTTIRRT